MMRLCSLWMLHMMRLCSLWNISPPQQQYQHQSSALFVRIFKNHCTHGNSTSTKCQSECKVTQHYVIPWNGSFNEDLNFSVFFSKAKRLVGRLSSSFGVTCPAALSSTSHIQEALVRSFSAIATAILAAEYSCIFYGHKFSPKLLLTKSANVCNLLTTVVRVAMTE